MRNPNLAFFTLLLVGYWGGLLIWLKREISRSFFDPRLRWFHGLPKPIAGLTCEISIGGGSSGEERTVSFGVCRIDQEGAFVFKDLAPLESAEISRSTPSTLNFQFRERRIRCQGTLVRLMQDKLGAGFQFGNMSPDQHKQLGDFVEILRGEGYVH